MIKKIYLFFLLIVGIGISVIAGFFSISGLTAIFKGSEFSVLLMGTFLEIAKVNVSIYLHLFWKDIRKLFINSSYYFNDDYFIRYLWIFK